MSFLIALNTNLKSTLPYYIYVDFFDATNISSKVKLGTTEYNATVEFTLTQDTPIIVNVVVRSGYVINGYVYIYPMIYRDGSVQDYVPPAMSNRELTKNAIITQMYSGSLNDLTQTFIGYGYGVSDSPGSGWGFIINIATDVEGSLQINQQFCQNDQTVWHCRRYGGGTWSSWT